jgi:hypothetical protein
MKHISLSRIRFWMLYTHHISIMLKQVIDQLIEIRAKLGAKTQYVLTSSNSSPIWLLGGFL